MSIIFSKAGLGKTLAILIVLVLAGGIVGGGYFAMNQATNPSPSSSPSSTPTPILPAQTLSPTATQTSSLPPSTFTPTSPPTPTPTPTLNPTPKPEAQPITLSGVGQEATSSFVLESGLAVFTLTHDGESNFIVWLYDGNGDRVELLVNEIGPYSGSRMVGVTGQISQASPGRHLLDITADGNWQVTIKQPRAETAPNLPQTLAGTGSSVPTPFTLAAGLAKFEITHTGHSNFIVWLYAANGERIELLVNEIGSYSGSTIVGVTGKILQASPGIHYLDIEADGNWSIIISST